jgi:hypothetical protein
VARKSPQRPNADEPNTTVDKVEDDLDATGQLSSDDPDTSVAEQSDTTDDTAAAVASADAAESDDAAEATSATGSSLWSDVRVDPIELALPAGVGYTLRAYRLSTDLAPTEIDDREEEDDPFAARPVDDEEEVIILDEEFAALTADDPDTERARGDDPDADGHTPADEPAAEADDDEDEGNKVVEEVPFFLSHRGKLLLFKSPESLVAFVRSGAPHDLAQLDTWSQLAERLEPAHVAAPDDDSYELDLVVENLRGGNDTWDLDLLIRAGEVARDLGYALRLPPVITALSPGSPLDELDDAMRSAAGGGIGGFMGRRRLRRIGAQQASLGWRTIIGKISAAVDWRD